LTPPKRDPVRALAESAISAWIKTPAMTFQSGGRFFMRKIA